MSTSAALERFIEQNAGDLQIMGLLLCRLLASDLCTISAKPSPILAAVFSLSDSGKLGTEKQASTLVTEFIHIGEEPLTDGCGGSILRL